MYKAGSYEVNISKRKHILEMVELLNPDRFRSAGQYGGRSMIPHEFETFKKKLLKCITETKFIYNIHTCTKYPTVRQYFCPCGCITKLAFF